MGERTYASGHAGERGKRSRKKDEGENHVLKALSSYSQEKIQRAIADFKSAPKRVQDPTSRAIFAKVQAKLQVSQPQDAEEVQADKVAEGVTKGDTDHSKKALSEKTTQNINAKSEGDVLQTPGAFDEKLQNTKGQGQKLDEKTKGELEQHTDTDLSNVNIHTHSDASKMSEDINAKAFTHGQDIYFKEGKYNPNSKDGKELLAHEVAHTVQQGENQPQKVQKKPVNPSIKKNYKKISPPEKYKIIKVTGLFSDDSVKSTWELILRPSMKFTITAYWVSEDGMWLYSKYDSKHQGYVKRSDVTPEIQTPKDQLLNLRIPYNNNQPDKTNVSIEVPKNFNPQNNKLE